ncbi:acyl carrier protein [Paenibacillus xylaniclasticus]|uniref:acyl carrier protein n=1 Tax=Paenibacillus xylaniclasticus TaxID=588083 RepID=UPI000FD79D16|nr:MULTISPECIES: acyl carrier protein [Paenibacillus]GFN32238.1 hypothetical protein PCURB6_24980 [Paenibacillus curdlanolyticus]
MEWTNVRIEELITANIRKTLRMGSAPIDLDSLLESDLGMDSIDMLDLLHGIEKSLHVTIELSDFAAYFRGPLSEEAFRDENGLMTEEGCRQIEKVLPHASVEPGTHIRHLFKVLRVSDLITFVSFKAGLPVSQPT